MNTVIAFAACAALVLIILMAAFWLWRRRSAKKGMVAPARTVEKAAERKTVEKTAEARTIEKAAEGNVASPAKASDKTAPPQPTPARPATPPPQPAAAVSSPAPDKPAPAPVPEPAKQYGQNDLREKIRILVVDDNVETRGHVTRLLYFEKDMEVLGQAVNGRQGLEMAAKLKPHIVLMDINMPDMDGITATQQMSIEAPFSQVIVMSVQADQHYMRQAMAAGARDFQPKPFTSYELNNCIRRVYNISLPIYQQMENAGRVEAQRAVARPEKTVREGDLSSLVVAVYSPKGGTGVSTIAANLAVALQKEYGDIVLVDADLQFGDIMVHLNTKATRTISDLIYEGEFDIELLPDVVLAHNSGLKLLLAPARPELADAVLPEMLAEVIKALKQQFKLVVVDTDSHLSDKTVRVLEAADYVLLVATPELPAVKNAKIFLEIAGLLKFGPDRLSLVLNRVGIPGGVSADKIEQVLKVDHSYRIPYDPRIHIAINKGVAVNQQDITAPSAQVITQIAQELGQLLALEARPAPPVKEKEAV